MKSLFELIPLLIGNVFYVFIINIYEPVAQSSLYFSFWIILTLSEIGLNAMSQCITLLGGDNFNITFVTLAGIYLFAMVLSGSFVMHFEMPYIYQMLSVFSIPRFIFESSLLLLFGFGRCREKEVNIVLYNMNFHDDDYFFSIGMILFNIVLYRSLALYVLIRRVNPVENRRKRIARIVQHKTKI